jgi:hypothetical protein
MYDMTGGVTGYNKNTDQTAQSSDMFKALLQQSMQQGQPPGIGGIFSNMLGTYMQGQMNPNMQGSMAYNNALGSDIGSGIQVAMPEMQI